MNYTKQAGYLCVSQATTALEGRCRNVAQKDGFCHSPHAPGYPIAEPAKVVLVQLWLSNNRLHDRARELEFPVRERSLVAVQERHEVEAALLRRSFTAYRPLGDTGCSVFGKQQLTNVVAMSRLANQLEEEGFILDGTVFGENTIDGGKSGIRLPLRFRHESLDAEVQPLYECRNTPEQLDFVKRLLRVNKWMKVAVFDNVPKYYVKYEGRTLQFQPLEDPATGAGLDRSIDVQVLYPHQDQMEMDPELFGQVIRFSTSTINCRIPFPSGVWSEDAVRIAHNKGSWALHYATVRKGVGVRG